MNGTAPNGTYSDDLLEYFPDGVNNVIDLVKMDYPVDEDRINCVGYSMGSHGCWALQ
jgi:predicted peptidase